MDQALSTPEDFLPADCTGNPPIVESKAAALYALFLACLPKSQLKWRRR